jgi:3',5'-cyclic AMP phosphodiesterase CpdA
MAKLHRRFIQFLFLVLTGCMIFIVTETTFAQDQKIKFAVISDHKTNEDYSGLENALTFISDQNVDFIIVAGDFSPIGNAYTNYYSMWGFEVSEEKSPEIQDVYFVMGNHDKEPYGEIFFQENIAPYYPANGPYDAPEGTIFSFDRGDAHFVITNQYWHIEGGGYTSAQLDWIEDDLKASDQRYKFVIGHEPAFPMDRHVGDSLDFDPVMRDDFWTLLVDNGVQAFFCGHTHHLSVVKEQGVYQIDTGRVVSDHLAIAIVEIDGPSAVVRIYETKGSIPEAANNDNTFNASLRDGDSDDTAYSVVFSSGIREEDNFLGCFIRILSP